MIQRDYHSFTLLEALEDVNSIVGNVRLKGISEDVEFIVGHGIIKTELLKFLLAYDLSPTVQIGNSGVVLCTIE